MSYYRPDPGRRDFLLGSTFSSAVRLLIAWNTILFLIQQLMGPWMEYYFGLRPQAVWHGEVWQLVTYMFLHGGFFHIFFNMLVLWMFGSQLEHLWGSRRFITYYFVTGIGGALLQVVVHATSNGLVYGASGATYGLLLAYAVIFPNRPVFLYMVMPIPAKYFVMFLAGIELLFTISGANTGIAHLVHLGGVVSGWIYLKGFPGGRALRKIRSERQRRKFKVLEFRDPDDD